jgi:hypothetical protein
MCEEGENIFSDSLRRDDWPTLTRTVSSLQSRCTPEATTDTWLFDLNLHCGFRLTAPTKAHGPVQAANRKSAGATTSSILSVNWTGVSQIEHLPQASRLHDAKTFKPENGRKRLLTKHILWMPCRFVRRRGYGHRLAKDKVFVSLAEASRVFNSRSKPVKEQSNKFRDEP